jgi:hypothetical protein
LLLHVLVAVAQQLDEQFHALQGVHLRQRLGVLGTARERETGVAKNFAVVGREQLDQGWDAAQLKQKQNEGLN